MDRRRSRARRLHTSEQSSSHAGNRISPSNRLEDKPDEPPSTSTVKDDRSSADTLSAADVVIEEEQAYDMDRMILVEGVEEFLEESPRDVAAHEEVADLFIAEALLDGSSTTQDAPEDDEAPPERLDVRLIDSQGVSQLREQFAQEDGVVALNDGVDWFVLRGDDVQMDAVEIWPPPGQPHSDPDIGPMLADGVQQRRPRRLRTPTAPSSIVTRSARRAEVAATLRRSASPQGPWPHLEEYIISSSPSIDSLYSVPSSPPPPPLRRRRFQNSPPAIDEAEVERLSQELNERMNGERDLDRLLDELFEDIQRTHRAAFRARLPESDEDDIEVLDILERRARRAGYGEENEEEEAQNIERENMERAERIKKAVDANNHKDSLLKRYSRTCGICTTPNPPVRYALAACGHMVCAACVEQLNRVSSKEVTCPFCRAETSYVRLFEVEEESVDGHAAEVAMEAPAAPAATPAAATKGRRKRAAPSSSAIVTRSARRAAQRRLAAHT
ncbi:hypothetical protein PMAYCL1PPCAC_25159 [Pristionchus mayeri]|uniref:RING-type domain-containing protein n=1 Tax=Pristionchus mayeri TaxID=1317129 RepID=A0AAN5D252_9BILA|nr:hypothetical protein PMAYCL1PPCAC_25159 [Pristionchus mayeri]